MGIAFSSFWFYIILITCYVHGCNNNGDNVTSPLLGKSNSYNPELESVFQFTANKVKNQYIVSFLYYYMSNTRKRFIEAVMKKAKIYKWKVISRMNPANVYPSDFDVIETMDLFTQKHLKIFLAHPSIKSVTPHNIVKRSINYTPLSDWDKLDEIFFEASASRNNSKHFQKTKRFSGRRLLRAIPLQITTVLGVNKLWDSGITGHGIKVAVFDTGLSKSHPHFRNVKERTNWTNEKSLDDGVSHGTFVAGVIASAEECLGLAPDAELHVYRVFTNTQVSYTSWFLDAFNYAIVKKINVINLSIGGPDFLDSPFVEKVLELSANKIIMVSAIGNDGPTYGTLNNPGDQSDVVGVGGINFKENVAKFSSRGMTTWELPQGYGRLKPDIVTYGSQVKGSNLKGGCRLLSGTSVASPVVAGAVTLLASGVLKRLEIINPSSMKQVLLAGATRLSANNMFEQGHGKLNILKSMDLLATYVPKVTLSPAYLDSSESYMWPYSSQPLFCGSEPIIVNVTILNGIAVTGYILESPSWHPYTKHHESFLNVSVTISRILWPWCGWMAVNIAVNKQGCNYEGMSNGYIKFIVQSRPATNANTSINSTVIFPINVKIIPKPPRHKRILWDQFHNLRYPPGYLPRDNLNIKADPLDWKADHIHTNFRDMYQHLRNSGYYIDVLRESFNCFDAAKYGTILIVDPEEEYFEEEIKKLQNDVYYNNLSIIIFADWYNTTVMKKIKFFDENTRQWWIPDTGGANIPALNELLKPFNIAMGDFVAEGYYSIGEHKMYYASGSVIVKFPETSDSILIGAHLRDQGLEIIENIESKSVIKHFVPILGLIHAKDLLHTHYYNTSSFVQYSYEDSTIEAIKAEQSIERNPLLNKRILLKSDFKHVDNTYLRSSNDEYSIKTKKNNKKRENETKKTSDLLNSEGRIALFGDSNCLDSSHIEKPCYWLLDMLLEFTMNSQVSNVLRNFNKMSDFKSLKTKKLPLRLPTSNLHLYSKVLDSKNMRRKMPIQTCQKLIWSLEKKYDVIIEP